MTAKNNPSGTIVVPWPFYRASISDPYMDTDSWWVPGHETTYDQMGNERRYADGMGEMILTVIHVCTLPKPYKARVFHTRQFKAPDGYVFGKRVLRVSGIAAFRKMASGYAYPVEVDHDQ